MICTIYMIGVESNGRAQFRSNAGDMPGTIAYVLPVQ